MLGMDPASLLKNALQGTGFVRRGAAFFRVWGDGVLQVLKFVHQRGDRVPDLCVGIFSMYGSLDPAWFTSGGCIPRGSVSEFVGLRFVDGYLSPDRFTETGHGQFLYDGFPVTVDPGHRMRDERGERWRYCFTPAQQVHIFAKKMLPWLNEMTTQSLAAEAMYQICPVSNDSLRFDAHLAAGEWHRAGQTMAAILKQHADALASWKKTFSPERFAQMAAQQKTRDAPLKAAYQMVLDQDEDAIARYLSDNHRRNRSLAKFCMKQI